MSNLLMVWEIKAGVYQLSVYDPSPLPLILPLLFRHLERDTGSVENDLQEVTPPSLPRSTFSSLPSCLSCRVT